MASVQCRFWLFSQIPRKFSHRGMEKRVDLRYDGGTKEAIHNESE